MFSFDTAAPIDISLGIKRNNVGVNCFFTERPQFIPYQAGTFTGSVAAGGACNVDVISFTPHGNGTHTECIGHINSKGRTIPETLRNSHVLCSVISATPLQVNDDRVITLEMVMQAQVGDGIEAVALRTLPNLNKESFDYSGTNPAYFAPDALKWLNGKGIKHLLCDIPSVDREDDGGKLLAHKAFFGEPENPEMHATITELIYIPDQILDGIYMLNLQIANFESDASPSRPLLFSISPVI